MDNKILVTRSSMPDFDEYVSEIKELWQSRWLTNSGVKHRELQNALASYLGVENIDLFTNGHMALELCIQAMGLTGEVITTPFTFASTTHSIVRNGLEPVFCDINPIDFTIDTNKVLRIRLEALIFDYENTRKTIIETLGLKEEDHIEKQKYFKPRVSMRGTQLYKKIPGHSEEIAYIERELKEYLFDFESYELSRSNTELFKNYNWISEDNKM